ncbi:cell division cycle 25 homolog d [Clarias gariepinus]
MFAMSGDEQDTGWSVSELCSSMKGLQCEDRRRLALTPELNSPDRGRPSGEHTPTGSRRRSYRRVTSPEHTSSTCGSRHRILTGGSEDDEGAEDDKENTRVRKRLRVRLFSSSSPDDQLHAVRGSKRQSNSSPAEGEAETPDSELLMLFQRLRSRRTPAHTLVPDSTIADHCLIGDFTKHHVLPVEQVTHQDLHCVSAQTAKPSLLRLAHTGHASFTKTDTHTGHTSFTDPNTHLLPVLMCPSCVVLQVASLIRGQFSAVVEDFLVVDCRYPYEYRGGHIRGAVNLYTETQILQAFLQGSSTPQTSPVPRGAPGGASALGARGAGGATPESGLSEGASSPRKLIVFHCEFSSERGPRLCQYLRELDRAINAQTYPYLLYPELYLLQGGYKHFYFCCPELCEPCGYVPMHHKDFRDQLHRFSRKRRQSRRRRLVRTQQRMSRS